jgi:integrase
MPLTNIAIKNAKPSEFAYSKSDGGGLHLRISPNGSKLWRLAYRFRGKQKLVSFGPYPSVSLLDARERREEAKRALREGKDPARIKAEKELAAIRAEKNTFRVAAEEYIARRRDVSDQTISVYRWYIEDVLDTPFCERPIRDISPGEISDVLLRIDASGRQETARRIRWFIGRVFQHANMTGRVTGDPTSVLKGVLPPREKQSYAAITDPEKLGGLLAAIDEFDGWPTIRWALQIGALCFVRPGEIRHAVWNEVDFEEKIWRIPAERMKMKRPHDVPLSRQALGVFAEARKVSGHVKLIFPQIRSFHRPISENAMNAALRRLGFTKEEHTAHGFRSSASTILNEHGFRHDVIERQLAHIEANEIRRAYNRAQYWPERVVMMQAWADMLERFRALTFSTKP